MQKMLGNAELGLSNLRRVINDKNIQVTIQLVHFC